MLQMLVGVHELYELVVHDPGRVCLFHPAHELVGPHAKHPETARQRMLLVVLQPLHALVARVPVVLEQVVRRERAFVLVRHHHDVTRLQVVRGEGRHVHGGRDLTRRGVRQEPLDLVPMAHGDAGLVCHDARERRPARGVLADPTEHPLRKAVVVARGVVHHVECHDAAQSRLGQRLGVALSLLPIVVGQAHGMPDLVNERAGSFHGMGRFVNQHDGPRTHAIELLHETGLARARPPRASPALVQAGKPYDGHVDDAVGVPVELPVVDPLVQRGQGLGQKRASRILVGRPRQLRLIVIHLARDRELAI